MCLAGVDTQDNRLAYVIRAYGRHEESWGIAHGEIYGDTSKPEVWAKLAERLDEPRVPAAALHGMPDCYKIKLHSLGYRLVYRVDAQEVFVTVIATGKRDKSQVYGTALKRL